MHPQLSTELVRLQALTRAINESESKLELALEIADIGIWNWNIKTNELKWDARMMRLFEISEDEFKPNYQFFESRVHPADLKHVNEAVAQALKGEYYSYSYRVKCVHGGYKKILAKGRVIFDDEGHALEMVGVCLVGDGCA